MLKSLVLNEFVPQGLVLDTDQTGSIVLFFKSLNLRMPLSSFMSLRCLPALFALLISLSFYPTHQAFAQLPGFLSANKPAVMATNDADDTGVTAAVDTETLIVTEQEDHRVFGQNLFSGSFGRQQFTGFNPDYRIAVGDKVLLQLWGAVESQGEQVVDAQGNIFIPQVGPVTIAGVLNSELNNAVAKALARIYKKDVHVYASLLSSQPVKVFVTGNVLYPGLYSGLSSESILAYLDRAGGIDPLRGSYLDIALKRGNRTIETFNLYDFLVQGKLPQRQLYEGDVVVVGSRKSVINFTGVVKNPYQIEFVSKAVELSVALQLVQPLPSATHIAIERNQGLVKQVEYLNMKQALAERLMLFAGDSVAVVSDKIQGSIGVQVDGEHLGQAQYVLPYGAKLSDLIEKIKPSSLSNLSALQLYRVSLADKQRDALLTTLNTLQSQVLSSRSDTVEEASLRTQEAKLVLQFIERAKQVEPKGQVVLDGNLAFGDVVLENGDTIVIPAENNLVRVNGEVLFPNAVIFDPKLSAKDYIRLAGGYSQNAKKSRVMLKKPNGAVLQLDAKRGGLKASGFEVAAGDEILVLPDVDTKSFQHAKDIFQIVYQLALSAGVVLSI